MNAVDTNVLVRVIVADDQHQTAVARALVERALDEGAAIFVSDTVLCETAWVLDSCYSAPRFTIADALAGLLAAEQLADPLKGQRVGRVLKSDRLEDMASQLGSPCT